MNLYIEIKDGQPINHPAFEDNLIQALGSVPSHWEPFIRVERPVLGIHEVLNSEIPTYEKVNGTWTDVWSIREMTAEEKETAKQIVQTTIKEIKEAWLQRWQSENWSAWIFNEDSMVYEPPIPRPMPDQSKLDQRIFTYWCGADNNWKDTPIRPEGNYKFDFFAWEWIEVAQ